jgi:hypothetical protein
MVDQESSGVLFLEVLGISHWLGTACSIRIISEGACEQALN